MLGLNLARGDRRVLTGDLDDDVAQQVLARVEPREWLTTAGQDLVDALVAPEVTVVGGRIIGEACAQQGPITLIERGRIPNQQILDRLALKQANQHRSVVSVGHGRSA